MPRLLSSKGKWEKSRRREHRPRSGHPRSLYTSRDPLEESNMVARAIGLDFSLTEKTQRLRERIQPAKCLPYKPEELGLSSRTCGKERKATKTPETSVRLWTPIIPVVWVCR